MNMPRLPGADVAGYMRAFLGGHAAKLRDALREKDRGASAIELAIISAALVALALAIVLIVTTFAKNQANKIQDGGGVGGGGAGGGGGGAGGGGGGTGG
jgi:uncharacterized membrane protein